VLDSRACVQSALQLLDSSGVGVLEQKLLWADAVDSPDKHPMDNGSFECSQLTPTPCFGDQGERAGKGPRTGSGLWGRAAGEAG